MPILSEARRADLIHLIEADDLTGLLIATGQEWCGRYYPATQRASVVVDLGDLTPTTHLVLISEACPASALGVGS